MPGIVRANADRHQGHFGVLVPYHKTSYGGGSGNVFVNNNSVIRQGDSCQCSDTAIGHSSTVFVNNKPVHRQGDATSGHGTWFPNSAETGSPNVFADS